VAEGSGQERIVMSLPIVDILKLGLAGAAFLFLYLAFSLLRSEQKKDQPRQLILKSIHIFMLLCFAFTLMVGLSDLSMHYLGLIPKPPPQRD